MSIKIYIAAPFAERAKMPEVAARVEGLGYVVTHKWWEVEEDESEKDPKRLREIAKMDFKGVADAKVVLLLNSSKSEGKAVEQGVALANNIPIIAVGKIGEFSKNVFHYMDRYHWVDDIEKAMVVLDFVRTIIDMEE